MAHNIETMMYVRETPWHGLGTKVDEAVNSTDALRLAGLDWTVEKKDLYQMMEIPSDDGSQTFMHMAVPNYKLNVRSSDNKVLGVVSDRYKIVQNTEAFAFTDGIVGETENGIVKYETAGSLQEGKKIWMLAKMPEAKILGDAIDPYLCFTNSHDGTSSIRACMTPVRVVCNNTLNLALNNAKRQWSTKHVGNLDAKMEEAKMCLGLADMYMQNLGEYAEQKIGRAHV